MNIKMNEKLYSIWFYKTTTKKIAFKYIQENFK